MTYNYHAHTWRCSHATGTEEEYIRKAIAGGVTHMGFSDHAPISFTDKYNTGWRVPVDKAQEYVDLVEISVENLVNFFLTGISPT